MFKGPKGPVSGRTPRTRAEEMNDPQNFKDGPAYDFVDGHPITKEAPLQPYVEKALPAPAPRGPVSDHEAPFTIKR